MPAAMPPEGSLRRRHACASRAARRASRSSTRCVADQKKLVDEHLGDAARPTCRSPTSNEFVTLASIVEKETGARDERSRVAAVFINRLSKGMRLQSDPTIIYGLFGGKGKPADRPIYQSDIDKPTPYNTYVDQRPAADADRQSGPRGAGSGRQSVAQTDDLYFVADGTGGHVFAATLEEHNENVARWRAIAEEAGRGSRQGLPTRPRRRR